MSYPVAVPNFVLKNVEFLLQHWNHYKGKKLSDKWKLLAVKVKAGRKIKYYTCQFHFVGHNGVVL